MKKKNYKGLSFMRLLWPGDRIFDAPTGVSSEDNAPVPPDMRAWFFLLNACLHIIKGKSTTCQK